MFRNLRLSTKIFAVVGLLVLVVAGISLIAIDAMRTYNQRVHRLQHVMHAAIAGEQMKGLVLQALVNSRGISTATDHADAAKFAQAIEKNIVEIKQKIAEWNDYSETEDAAQIARVNQAADQFIKLRTELVRLSREATLPEAADFADSSQNRASQAELNKAIETMTGASAEHLRTAAEQSQQFYASTLVKMSGLGAAGIFLGILALFLVIGQITRPVARLTERVTDNIRRVALAATQASDAVTQVADGSNVQLAALAQAGTALQQSTEAISEVARSTQLASERAKEAANLVADGIRQMDTMVEVVNAISGTSSRISDIASAISRIASQTNMLSLNAAIEAARAGEHGRGFAVVADEVRKLAENSGNLAREIANLNQQATEAADSGVAVAQQVSGNMRRIAEGVQQSDHLATAIASAMEQQQATVKRINANVADLNRIGQANATAAEEITATMIDLSKLTERSRVEVDEFRKVGL